MRPYLLKGHERPLTQVKYNREGDLLISCAKNLQPCLWFADDGKRIGTFEGHKGAVWTCAITLDSSRLITASADSTVRVWSMQTGQELYQYQGQQPCRAVDLCVGDTMIAFTSDEFMGKLPGIHIHKLQGDDTSSSLECIRDMEVESKGRITRVYWTDQNQTLITAHDSGILRRWDVETGKVTMESQVHKDSIQDLQIHPDGVQGITASLDMTAKLIDVESLEVIKTYQTGRFVQSAAISPLLDHVLLGGGQDASQVTTTAAKAGGFEARFFHKVFGEEFGNVRGHFGPINTVAFSPNGRSFTTGGEDGYVRVHHFDIDYFTTKFF